MQVFDLIYHHVIQLIQFLFAEGKTENIEEKKAGEEEESGSDEESDSESEEESEEDDEGRGQSDAIKKRERALQRIKV